MSKYIEFVFKVVFTFSYDWQDGIGTQKKVQLTT